MFKDLTGKKFGLLTAIEQSGETSWRNILWKCKCQCGNEVVVPSGKLVSGRKHDCGCMETINRSKAASKHGITAGGKPRTFIIWNGMKSRCNNPKSVSYKNYGARGIKICEEWMTYENFHKWAIANGYADGLEIDRIDNNGNYCPSNCRWITQAENRKKTRNIHNITINGETHNVSEWCRMLHMSKSTAYKYLKKGDQYFISKIRRRQA